MKRINKFFVVSLSFFVSSRILANPVTVTVDGTSYDLTTTNITDHGNLTEQETLKLMLEWKELNKEEDILIKYYNIYFTN